MQAKVRLESILVAEESSNLGVVVAVEGFELDELLLLIPMKLNDVL